MFVVYIACLFLPKNGQIGWYRIMMVVAIVFFGGGGVLGNIVRYLDGGAALYAGVGAWVVALAINAFGTVCNIIAALGLFRPSPREMN